MKKAIKRKLKLLDLGRIKDTPKCIFCGSPDVTKEHVFSKRFHKFMDPARAKAAKGVMTFIGQKSEQVTIKWPGPLRDWQVKCVCGGTAKTCNNGWMRELDQAMESAASRLMRLPEENIPFRVSETDQKVIATWAIMKVMVVNNDMVHHTQRKQMRSKIVPPGGWGVWIGHYKRAGTWNEEWVSRPFALIRPELVPRRKSKIAKSNSHATTIILQNLFIHVVYCRHRLIVTKWRFSTPQSGILSGHIFRIWPALGHSLLWPGKVLTDQDGRIISDAIFNCIMTAARNLKLVPPERPPIIYD